MNTDIAHCEASSASVPPHIVTNYIFTELQLPIHHKVKTPAQIIIIHIALHWIGLDWAYNTHLHNFAPTKYFNSFITFSLFSLILKRDEARRRNLFFLTVLFQHTTMIPDTQNTILKLFLHFHPAKSTQGQRPRL